MLLSGNVVPESKRKNGPKPKAQGRRRLYLGFFFKGAPASHPFNIFPIINHPFWVPTVFFESLKSGKMCRHGPNDCSFSQQAIL